MRSWSGEVVISSSTPSRKAMRGLGFGPRSVRNPVDVQDHALIGVGRELALCGS
jgi:hypothetical protein